MITLPPRYVPQPIRPSRGGMSHAQVCKDNHLDRLVLVKELQDGVESRRLRDEVVALAAIRSKHVVQLYDVIKDENGGIVGLVEEYIPGADLNSIIPVSDPVEILRIGYAIACGLADIHQAGRIHRDIKPGNMKFDAEGCLKIFDFGLARTDQQDSLTRGAVGTDGYMAPEICVGDEDDVWFSQAIDTYAFAATMLKVVRGAIPGPMRAVTPRVTAEADFSQQPVTIASDVATVLNSCLSADAHLRPSMAVVRDLLGAHLLKDTHRATFVVNNSVYQLGAQRTTVKISQGRLGTVSLGYDGLRFQITATSGEVFVNNVQITAPHTLPGSCVVTVGGQEWGVSRAHIPIDVSHPEVVL